MKKKTTDRLSKMELAAQLGIARSTLYVYLGREGAPKPDKDGRYDLEKVASWVTANAPRAMDDEIIQELRTRKLRMEVERLERDNAVARNELLRREDIEPALTRFGASVTAALEQIIVHELPQKCVGLDAIDIRIQCEQAVDRAIREIKAGAWEVQGPKTDA